jgi:hypothetical protein
VPAGQLLIGQVMLLPAGAAACVTCVTCVTCPGGQQVEGCTCAQLVGARPPCCQPVNHM